MPPSRRVAAGGIRNTAHWLVFGNERKEIQQQWGCEMTGASSLRPYVSARGLAQLRQRLLPRDLAILEQVAELRLMSARQIQAVYFPDSEHHSRPAATRARQRVLERLTRDQLLIPLERRIGGVRAGSAGLVLGLGAVGQRLLEQGGPRRRAYEPTLRFVDHSLAVSQLVVDVTVAARDGVLEVLEAQAEPRSWRKFSGPGGRRVLRPDAFLSLGVSDYELRWFIEVDRATESLPTIQRKCQLYADYYQSGSEQTRYGVFPRVGWITPDEGRAEQLRQTITGDRTLPARLFRVTSETSALDILRET
jgi:Replication-relaxation